MAALEVEMMCCSYAGHPVLQNLSLRIETGQLCCLLGPSGCGKTTALRAIAGLEPLQAGIVRSEGKTLSTALRRMPPERRHIGLVFQDYALFPHLSVADNIGFGIHRLGADERRRRIATLLKMTQLPESIAARYPHELSGGQQQRVAIARALAPEPKLLLLDEPFSNLDAGLRRQLNLHLRALLRRQGISALLVTHDQEEAFAFADQMGVIRNGKLQQWDSAYALYHSPANRFVAIFTGRGDFIDGEIRADGAVRTAFGDFRPSRHPAPGVGAKVDVLIRPDDILHAAGSAIRGRVTGRVFAGDRILYHLRLTDGAQVQSLMPSHLNFELDEDIGLHADLEHVIVFERTEKQAAATVPDAAPQMPRRDVFRV